jgi:FkbM family methyltransferase
MMGLPPMAELPLRQIDSRYLRSVRWFGVKNVVAGALRVRSVNAAAAWLGRKVLPGQLHRRLPAPRGTAAYVMADGQSVRLADAHRDLVARDIHWGEGRPASAAELLKLRSLERLCGDAGTFLDIGAYSGICALIAARSSADVRSIAYEIVPENYYLLTRNIVENDLVGRVAARLCGLGASEGEMVVPEYLHLPSLETSFSLGSCFHSGVRIPIRTLDAETASMQPPFVIKIDVEGFEPEVLQGGAAFLEQHRPDIICEVLPGAGTAPRLNAILAPLGYRFFEFTDEGAEPRPAIEAGSVMRDWLFTVREDWQPATPGR